jgi:deoxycytidine triphosphate deaminase
MKNRIFCGIASSLEIKFDEITNVTFIKVDSNEDIKPKEFSVLILDKTTHSLYSQKQFISEKNFDVIAYYDKDSNRPQDVVEVLDCFDHLLSFPGVLSHQQISTLMKLGILLYNGDQRRVRGASYDLIIDKEHLKSGIKVDSTDTFKIDPLDYVVVGAVESVNIPKNICASFDTKVSMFCKGIILSNGPQVDPGYQGRLLCLLFNTSAKAFEVSPTTGFEFSTIQFSALSEPTNISYTQKYFRKEHLKEYIGSFADASIADLVKAIPDMRNSIEDLKISHDDLKKKRFTPLHMVMTIIITLLIAAVTAAGFLGALNERIGAIEKRLGKVEDNKSTEKESTQKEDKSSLKENSKNLPEQKVINK